MGSDLEGHAMPEKFISIYRDNTVCTHETNLGTKVSPMATSIRGFVRFVGINSTLLKLILKVQVVFPWLVRGRVL